MPKNLSLWNLLASLPLAITTLFALALAAVAGTIVPQHQPPSSYIATFGEAGGQLLLFLQLDNMYGCWWFVGLLGLLVANLLICSLDRFPATLRLIQRDELAVSRTFLQGRTHVCQWQHKEQPPQLMDRLLSLLRQQGWQTRSRQSKERIIIHASKGSWSRLAVYLVHLSIILILAGAIVGKLFGFKGTIRLVESQASQQLQPHPQRPAIPFGFILRCDSFRVDHYPGGVIQAETAQLTVLESGKAPLARQLTINHPLHHNGITFYLSGHEAFHEFILRSQGQTLILPFGQQVQWPHSQLQLAIKDVRLHGKPEKLVKELKLWWQQPGQPGQEQWLLADQACRLTPGLQVNIKQLFAINLQVRKDPGVWLVYSGFSLLLAGLAFTFFSSHQRLWLLVEEGEQETELLLAGSSSRPSPAFSKRFKRLAQLCQQDNSFL